jgi:PAS domain S-box-containing protein
MDVLESEDKFRLMFENSPVGISMTSIDGSLKVNKAFCNILGYKEKEILNKKWFEITHPDDIKESQDIINDLISGKKDSARYEKRYIHKKGNIVWTDISTSLQRNKEGNPLYFITSINNITGLKDSSEKLKRSEERSGSYIALTGQIAWVTNSAGEVMEDIPHFRKFTGQTYDEVKGTGWVSALHPDDVAHTIQIWNEAVSSRAPYETEYRLKRFDGVYRYFLARSFPVFREDGSIEEWIGTCIDISERKEADKALRLKNLVFDVSIAGNSIADTNGIIKEANETFLKIWGYTSRDEVVDKPLSQFIKNAVEGIAIVDALNSTGQWEGDYTAIRKDGSTFIAHGLATVVKDETDKIIGYQSAVLDVTEAKMAEVALSEAKDNLEAKVIERTHELLNSKKLLDETGRLARVGGWEIDIKNNSIYWSETTHKIHEVDPGFVPVLETAINFYAPEAIPVISKCVDKAITLGEPFDVELELITAKKNRLWVRAIGEAYRENGEIVKIGGVFQDIDARKHIEEELKKHREHLEEMVSERTRELDKAISDLKRSNQELEQFAYVASHDLQEPLRMVSSYTQLLERRYKDQLDQDAKDFINFAVDGARRMQRLINDLLEYSRVTTKGKTLVKTDLSSVLGQALANLHNKIQETNALITNEDLPFAYCDEIQIVRLFQNLIDNAIKFRENEAPRIHIKGAVENDKILISVSDNGIGIDNIYSERVFAIFQRLHNKTEYEGTGIGLAICKRTVERHGGKIWFDSEPGKGTIFYFTLNK